VEGIPAWAVIGTQDRIITPGSQRQMAQHANARINEVEASHVSMLSRPDVVTDVIREVAAQVG
jgi:pimeloyl-ACP methyl ester carboxylesterase